MGLLKRWNVVVYRGGLGTDLGQVYEDSEELARLAALSKYGALEDDHGAEYAEGSDASKIYLLDDFSVYAAGY